VTIALLALGLFAVLAAARWLVAPSDDRAEDIEASYDELVQAIDESGLLPPVHVDVARGALLALAKDYTKLYEGRDPASGQWAVIVEGVAIARFTEQTVMAVDFKPAQWRELAPGNLRDMLRALSRISLKKHLAAQPSPPGVAQTNRELSYTIRAGVQNYRVRPVFNGEQLDIVTVELVN